MKFAYNKEHPLRVFEAFAGYGSQSCALERLKHDFPGFDYKVVGISEVEMNALAAYHAIHGFDIPNYGSICDIDWSEVPDFDLFTYSFPCTDISNAGLQKGLEEGSKTRSSLLWECRKTITNKHPKYLLMENVKSLLSKRFLPFFLKWLGELESYGYSNYYQVINAAQMGVPQHRERVFCVSILNDGSNQTFEFPKPFPLEKRLKDVLEDHVPENFYLTDKALAYFQRVGDDPSHGHKSKPLDAQKKTQSPSSSDAKQEAASMITSSSTEWSTDSRVANLMEKIVLLSQEEQETLYHDLGLMLGK
jgi:DNA-cytosine methyltransferase